MSSWHTLGTITEEWPRFMGQLNLEIVRTIVRQPPNSSANEVFSLRTTWAFLTGGNNAPFQPGWLWNFTGEGRSGRYLIPDRTVRVWREEGRGLPASDHPVSWPASDRNVSKRKGLCPISIALWSINQLSCWLFMVRQYCELSRSMSVIVWWWWLMLM